MGQVSANGRTADHPIDPLFLKRWSPRALSGEPITREELLTLFEAARWAPSSYNGQPWRFVYALRDSVQWQLYLDLLVAFNQAWAAKAGALVVVISRETFEHNGKPSRTHSFDAGSAWMSLALQASMRGLVAHGMEGFDYDKAKELLHVPDGYSVEAMIAIGKHGKKEDLPQNMQEQEHPNSRKSVDTFAFEGTFKE